MPSDEYTPITRGTLKLKGSTSSGITKKKKKKKQPSVTEEKGAALENAVESGRNSAAAAGQNSASVKAEDGMTKEEEEKIRDIEKDHDDEDEHRYDGKTPAERAAEEMRKKRLQHTSSHLLKTHKQRVEDLNKYLSNLSEHHDMPRIGPG